MSEMSKCFSGEAAVAFSCGRQPADRMPGHTNPAAKRRQQSPAAKLRQSIHRYSEIRPKPLDVASDIHRMLRLVARDIPHDIVSRDLKVDLSIATHGTFLATLCPDRTEKLPLSSLSGHLSGHCVRINDRKPSELAYPDSTTDHAGHHFTAGGKMALTGTRHETMILRSQIATSKQRHHEHEPADFLCARSVGISVPTPQILEH